MAEIPDTLRIGYQDVKITTGKFNHEEDAGKYHDLDAEICVNTNLSKREILCTLLHETLHACFHTYGIRDSGLIPERTEEYLATVLSQAMSQIFRDNPKLIEFVKKNV